MNNHTIDQLKEELDPIVMAYRLAGLAVSDTVRGEDIENIKFDVVRKDGSVTKCFIHILEGAVFVYMKSFFTCPYEEAIERISAEFGMFITEH